MCPVQKDIACVNIAHRVMSSMGWRSSEPLEPANEEIGVKPTLNAGSSRLQSWSSSPMWYDAEIKEWSYYMIKVTVVDNNYNRFYILKNLTDYVTRILPENLLRETVVIVE